MENIGVVLQLLVRAFNSIVDLRIRHAARKMAGYLDITFNSIVDLLDRVEELTSGRVVYSFNSIVDLPAISAVCQL